MKNGKSQSGKQEQNHIVIAQNYMLRFKVGEFHDNKTFYESVIVVETYIQVQTVS